MQFRHLIEDWMEVDGEEIDDAKPELKITKKELNILKDLVSILCGKNNSYEINYLHYRQIDIFDCVNCY